MEMKKVGSGDQQTIGSLRILGENFGEKVVIANLLEEKENVE